MGHYIKKRDARYAGSIVETYLMPHANIADVPHITTKSDPFDYTVVGK
jgi:hypothetical protein